MRSRVKTLSSFGDFSTVGFTMVGLGEPRSVQAGVVGGSYFQVMGLRPVLGRLLDAQDDGPNAAGAVVLTYRFWSDSAQERSLRDRQKRPARFVHRCAPGHRGGRFGAVRPLSPGHGNHRQHRHQRASSFSHHGHRPDTPDDRIVRQAGAGRGSGTSACGVAYGIRGHEAGASGGLSGQSGLPNQRREAARPAHVRERGPYCWC